MTAAAELCSAHQGNTHTLLHLSQLGAAVLLTQPKSLQKGKPERLWAAPCFVQPGIMKEADGAFPPLLSSHPDSKSRTEDAFSMKRWTEVLQAMGCYACKVVRVP